MATTAEASAPGRLCRYFSVVVMLAWPIRSLTTCRSAPAASSHDAWAWRRSWNRTGRIDAGEIDLTGSGGLIPELIRAALERGLQAELSDHEGYEKGDPEASLFENSRNGTTPKTVLSQVGDVPLDVPRDRDGTFVPRLVPKGSRRPGASTR